MKKLTINEIAEKAGVSKTTVSFYLNGKANKMSGETQQRIQQIIDETGYEPSAAARAMKAKSSGLIGVILRDTADAYCARALRGWRKRHLQRAVRCWWETAAIPLKMRKSMWSGC